MKDNTYPDPRVTRYVNERMVPVQYNVVDDPGARRRYHSYWTPSVILQDVEDNEHRRSYGALKPEQFLAEFSLGYALSFLHTGRFDEALGVFEEAIEYTSGDPLRNAENMYWFGVASYRMSDEAVDLENGWRELRTAHPDSDWARKTDFLFVLP